ncbi:MULTISPECIES: hypothetical protein [unclassified Leclercia]|uniref:hypothetical protein n=1 Tax=unclassified Leclercia TaxID=2627398 RepID=UPI0020748177|nr:MULTISPECIES: hypothetical protein [unclassified Leclercia]MCM5695686.1 hypothetical protein [Leclercia sp. LTM01]MCM5700095.1 hypothetical protein [Leclercia sp. LTM14]
MMMAIAVVMTIVVIVVVPMVVIIFVIILFGVIFVVFMLCDGSSDRCGAHTDGCGGKIGVFCATGQRCGHGEC